MELRKLLNIDQQSWKDPDLNGFCQISFCKAIILIAVLVFPVGIFTGIFIRHEWNAILYLQISVWLLSVFLLYKIRRTSQVRLTAFGYFALLISLFFVIILRSPAGDSSGIYHLVGPLILASVLLLGVKTALLPSAIFFLFYLSLIFDVWSGFGLDPIARVSPRRTSLYIDRCIEISCVVAIAYVYEWIKNRQQSKLQEQERTASQTRNLQAISSMAGGIAHEINNPLAIISLSLEYLENIELEPEDYFSHMNHIRSSADRIAKIVKSIMEIHHIPATDLSVINLNALVLALWHDIQIDAKPIQNKSMKPKISLQQSSVAVYTDQQTLAYILKSLLTNALEAIRDSKDGEIKVESTMSKAELMISISDNGPEYPLEELDHFAEPFFSTKMDHPGRGLGLTMVVAQMTQIAGSFDIKRVHGWTQAQIRIPCEQEQERLAA